GAVGWPGPWASRRKLPFSHALSRYAVSTGEPFAVESAADHPDLRAHPAIGALGIVAFASTPLTTAEGHVLGALCVGADRPRSWRAADLEMLADLAALAVAQLEHEAAGRERAPDRDRHTPGQVEAQFRTLFEQAPVSIQILA